MKPVIGSDCQSHSSAHAGGVTLPPVNKPLLEAHRQQKIVNLCTHPKHSLQSARQPQLNGRVD